jgi:hypothetical protein
MSDPGQYPPQDSNIPAGQQPPPYYTTSQPGYIQRPPRKRRGGCFSTCIFFFVVIVIVGLAVLFLPPFSLLERLFETPGYHDLDTANPSFTHESGLSIRADLMPDQTFGVSPEALGVSALTTGDADQTWKSAYRAIPSNLRLLSPLYTIDTRGTAPATVSLDVPAPAGLNPDTADLYTWDGSTWVFVPSRLSDDGAALTTKLDAVPDSLAVFDVGPLSPFTATVVESDQVIDNQSAMALNVVFPAGLETVATLAGEAVQDSAIQGELAAGIDPNAGYLVMPVVRNADPLTIAAILRDDQARGDHIVNLRELAAANDYHGVAIDYRDFPPDYGDAFTLFVEELGRQLNYDGRQLAVFVPGATFQDNLWQTDPYDWRAIGKAADMLVVTLLDDPAAYSDGGTVAQMLAWAVHEVDRYKVLVALSSLSQQEQGGQFTPVSYTDAVAPLGTVTLFSETGEQGDYFLPGATLELGLSPAPSDSGSDPATGATYLEVSGARTWLTTPRVLRQRLEVTQPLNLGGVCVLDLLDAGNMGDMVNTVAEFQANVAAAAADAAVEVQWTVRREGGDVVSQSVAGVSTPFAWTADEEGSYRISADLQGELGGSRGEVVVPVANPTPTPTPTPEPTATPVPAAPAASSSSSSGGESSSSSANEAPVVAAGSISGALELGGHVAHFGSVGYMQQAGMTWAKVQVPYNLGDGPGGAAGPISTAHGAGLKILLGIVGDPNQMASVGIDNYIPQFADYLAQVAALGPDAIEVWNEMNIDREWPQGQIDPAAYTRMLAAAYNAIKGVNGNVMVISGALAPTGAEGAYGTDRVWNDDRYYAGMASAGAANYMDCIGAHYNEGIVPPDWASGDPRGGFPSYYLSSMTDRAWAPFGGSRQVCYTELGYLTPEGFGALPAGFEWGADTTVAEQAAWLASAAVINANSGKVRLMIVWNVNFTNYEGDPMAGYAIIRPDGSCPACSTLAQVR